ncbi:hypothetical protein DMN91_009052 [Ooceraea biroi]|uniref:Endonuclease/exonuclease/phosphatase domain-containing protein n=1 Tax=Ooceraea biroi TaxID=2015173 RepID=A0A3L8DE36_OOCBI|nr:uncharacterized protein LOC105276634 [Ooceraea biroi]RLU18695.1 hypothetical protein DMN91_009052 [Ooceraea biroi]
MARMQLDLALIQEPWFYKGGSEGSPAAGRDLVAVRLEGTREGIPRDIVVASAYLPYDQSAGPPTEEVRRLMEYCRGKNLQLIMGCDANAHHIIWGSSDTKSRATLDISKSVCNWHVSDESSLSDHRYIRFDIDSKHTQCVESRNPRKTNWDKYKNVLETKLGEGPTKATTPTEVELLESSIRTAIHTAYEERCPLRRTRAKKKVPWWTEELSNLRRKVRKLFNRAKSTGAWEEYKTLLTEYNKSIRREKGTEWRRKCKSIESAPEYKKLQTTKSTA